MNFKPQKTPDFQDPEILTIKAIIGDAGVSASDAIRRVDASGITDSDFAHPMARALFVGVLAKLRSGEGLEMVSLLEAVGKHVNRELAMEVLSNFEMGVSEPRLKRTREHGRRRALQQALQSLHGLASSGADYATVRTEVLKTLNAMEEAQTGAKHGEAQVMRVVEHVEAIACGKRQPTMPTGIRVLDNLIGGLQPTLTIIGAEPGAGKSALMARIVRNLAERNTPVGVFSLEDQSEWMFRRMIAESSGIPVFVIQNKPLHDSQLPDFGDGAEKVHKIARNIIIEDRKGLTASDVVAGARSMIAQYGVKAIFVDHLGEIRINRTERHDRDIGDALRELRAIADVHRVPVVVLCHVRRREGVSEEPRLTDFAFSADVERTARVALALTKPKGDEFKQYVHILKQTSGKAGVNVGLRFNASAGMSTNEEAP